MLFPALLLSILLSLFCAPALADVSILKPVAGSTYSATGTMAISWQDDGVAPLLSTNVAALSILLCTGPNTNINCFYEIVSAVAPTSLDGAYTFTITPARALAASGTFYLQFYARTSNGGYTIHYSPRFSISDMTGTLVATAGGFTAPPDSDISYDADAVSGVSAETALNPLTAYTIPYTQQTGRFRYAPMQTQPGTKVTHKLSASQRFPTTSVSLFTTFVSKAYQTTTLTPSITYSITQAVNWATPQPDPSEYYAATEALARTINAKSRRWYVDL